MSKNADHFGHFGPNCGQFWTLWEHGGASPPHPGYRPVVLAHTFTGSTPVGPNGDHLGICSKV